MVPVATATHPTDAAGTPLQAVAVVSDEALRQYLEAKHSPLVGNSEQIVESPYWSTIIAISSIESQFCNRTPDYAEWNCWGLMRPEGGLQRLTMPEEGIEAIHSFLERAETVRGKPTIESMRGWYCYAGYNPPTHICPEWEPQVLRIKAEVEAL